LKKPPTLKADKRRTTVANEAARIIQEHGLSDFRFAKEKAVERLGLKNNGALPSNQEIERALAERNRIFKGQSHLTHLNNLRKAALSAMNSLNVFHVRLAGPVLSGNATEHSQIDLHLFTDSQESVAITLNELGIRHRSIQIRQRFRKHSPAIALTSKGQSSPQQSFRSCFVDTPRSVWSTASPCNAPEYGNFSVY
jgi:hypothetical protein